MNVSWDESYFRGRYVQTPNPAGYDEYGENTYWSENAASLAGKFFAKAQSLGTNLTAKKVLVVGCAYGHLVRYLVSLGVDAYGLDISSFAVSQTPVPTRLIIGDARLEADFVRAKTLAGLTRPADKFDLIIDEDVICCLTVAEAIVFCTLARKYGLLVMHLLTQNAPHLAQWYTYYTIAEWKALVDTKNKDRWYSRFTWSEV